MSRRRMVAIALLCWAGRPPELARADQGATGLGARNIESRSLQNGLEIITVEDHSVPLVTIELVVRAGSFVEGEGLNGLSHLYEHMFFKGNASTPDQRAYLARLDDLGIRYNAATAEEHVNYYFTLESSRLREAMGLMRDAVLRPLFEEEELDRERQVVLSELDLAQSSPVFGLAYQVESYLWRPWMARKNPLGERATIRSATRAQMVFFRQTYYLPNNAALVIAGDIEPENVRGLVDEMFGSWERGADPFAEHPRVVFPPLRRNEVVVVDARSEAARLRYAWQGPDVDRDRPATYAVDVLTALLFQTASTFQRALVGSGVTLDANFGTDLQQNVGPIFLNVTAQPENVLRSIEIVQEQLARMDDEDYFTDDQLETAQDLLEMGARRERERPSTLAHRIGAIWACCGLEYFNSYVEGIRAVTREELRRTVRRYIQGKPFVIGVLLGPRGGARAVLEPAAVARRVRGRLVPALTPFEPTGVASSRRPGPVGVRP